jgi:hypothetical protein
MTHQNPASPSLTTIAYDWSWLLVGGCPRSGTTLIQLVLNSHPRIRLTNELSIFNTLTALRSSFAREIAFEQWQERAKNHKENWTKETLASSIPRFQKCAGRMLRAMYEAQFEDQVDLASVKYFGDKQPMYYEEDIHALESLIGKVTILHLSRNPIDVINSMLRRSRNTGRGQDTWNLVHSVEDGCKHWARAWNAVQQLKAQGRIKVIHLKYEDLLESTSRFLVTLSALLGVENNFDYTRVVSEDPVSRDLVAPSDVARINEFLSGISADWSLGLDELEAKFQHLPL